MWATASLVSSLGLEFRFFFYFCACSYATIYRELERMILGSNTQEDLKWFSNNHGPGMHMNWPAFEVWRHTSHVCFLYAAFSHPLFHVFALSHQEYNPDQAAAPPKKKKPDGAPPTPSTDHVAPPGDRSRLLQEICCLQKYLWFLKRFCVNRMLHFALQNNARKVFSLGQILFWRVLFLAKQLVSFSVLYCTIWAYNFQAKMHNLSSKCYTLTTCLALCFFKAMWKYTHTNKMHTMQNLFGRNVTFCVF